MVIYSALSEVSKDHFYRVVGERVKLEEDVISFDVVVSNWFLVEKKHYMEHIPEYFQNHCYFCGEMILMFENPISEWAVVFFHDDDVRVADHSIVVHGGHPLV